MANDQGDERTYEVIDQKQTVGLLPNKTYGDVVRITFRVKSSGNVLAVDVPATAYNLDTARTMIEEVVTHAQAIDNL